MGPTQPHLHAWVKRFGKRVYEVYGEGDWLLDLGDGWSRPTGTWPRLSHEEASELEQAMSALDDLAEQVPVDDPWNAPHAAEWDLATLGDWIRSRSAEASGARVPPCFHGSSPRRRLVGRFASALPLLGEGTWLESSPPSGRPRPSKSRAGRTPWRRRPGMSLGTVSGSMPWFSASSTMAGERSLSSGEVGQVEAQNAIVAMSPAMASRISFAPALPGDQGERALRDAERRCGQVRSDLRGTVLALRGAQRHRPKRWERHQLDL